MHEHLIEPGRVVIKNHAESSNGPKAVHLSQSRFGTRCGYVHFIRGEGLDTSSAYATGARPALE
jgi:hypothetical protein